ncbi:hypothetical protein ACH5RR_000603 [Cinchona calisaya]|uniref:Uncharacterized protein n=1 Tax=Cinchona calisaya TaxID=153742 RepID=A0ABD3B275_9GENT
MVVDDIHDDEDDDVHKMLEDIQKSTLETGHCGSEGSPKIDKTQEDDNASYMSLLSSLLKLLHVMVLNKWSNKSWNMLVQVLKGILPEGERLLENCYEARKVLGGIGLGCEWIDACKNDCVIFWKEYKD